MTDQWQSRRTADPDLCK